MERKWRLVNDLICEIEGWTSIPVDCQECERFYDCCKLCYEPDNEFLT